MSFAKALAGCALAALSLSVSVSACGVAAKPQAGTAQAAALSPQRITDPRKKHIECLQAAKVPVRRETLGGYPSFQVGTRPSGPTVVFLATPGAAQNAQIQGRAQGAEVIGAALVYPNQAPDALLTQVETCVAKGVTG